jgi:hypothetical protein
MNFSRVSKAELDSGSELRSLEIWPMNVIVPVVGYRRPPVHRFSIRVRRSWISLDCKRCGSPCRRMISTSLSSPPGELIPQHLHPSSLLSHPKTNEEWHRQHPAHLSSAPFQQHLPKSCPEINPAYTLCSTPVVLQRPQHRSATQYPATRTTGPSSPAHRQPTAPMKAFATT